MERLKPGVHRIYVDELLNRNDEDESVDNYVAVSTDGANGDALECISVGIVK